MKFLKPFGVFLVINFGAIWLGTLLMQNGPETEWYLNLNKAPWTPAGWVFGAAWTSIMICFSGYMSFLYVNYFTKKTLILFVIQFVLNVSWNWLFFNQQLINLGLINIVSLTIVVGIFFLMYAKDLKLKSVLIAPYFVWLCIASSLNLYIALNN